MTWIAPSEKDTATNTLEKRLWASADTFVIHVRQPEHFVFVVACVSSDAVVAEASATANANGAKMHCANGDG